MMLAKITLNSSARNSPGGLVQGLTPSNLIYLRLRNHRIARLMRILTAATIAIEMTRANRTSLSTYYY